MASLLYIVETVLGIAGLALLVLAPCVTYSRYHRARGRVPGAKAIWNTYTVAYESIALGAVLIGAFSLGIPPVIRLVLALADAGLAFVAIAALALANSLEQRGRRMETGES